MNDAKLYYYNDPNDRRIVMLYSDEPDDAGLLYCHVLYCPHISSRVVLRYNHEEFHKKYTAIYPEKTSDN